MATKHPNVYIDTSAWTVRRYPSTLVEYLKGHGARKVLFGSNYPMIDPAKAARRDGRSGLVSGDHGAVSRWQRAQGVRARHCAISLM